MRLFNITAITLVLCLGSPGFATETDWTPENAKAIKTFLKESTQQKGRKVAVFDWDNTVIKNDVAEALFFWMLDNGKLKLPSSWRAQSGALTDQAAKDLESACAGGKITEGCRAKMLAYFEVKDVWNPQSFDRDVYEPSYAWAIQLLEGYTPSEVRSFAAQAIKKSLTLPLEKHGSVRVYTPIKKLIADLKRAGFEVWVSSASYQPVVEEFARYVGVPRERVIGVRSVLKDGKITPKFEGCGTFADGNEAIINYRKGKRCWINKIIFKEKDPQKQLETPSPIDFAAGDADTDAFFLKDARGLRIVINRNKEEILCHALNNVDGRWLLNPMFVLPKVKREKPYSCGKYGLKDRSE